MVRYVVNYLSAREGIGKNSGKPYYMLTCLLTIYDGDKISHSYPSTLFISKEQYEMVTALVPMQELDMICVPDTRGNISIVQLDIAD